MRYDMRRFNVGVPTKKNKISSRTELESKCFSTFTEQIMNDANS